jgi:purine-binding chemotaxis protein CheW
VGEPRVAPGAVEQARLLLFRSAGRRFSLDVSHVREILPRPEVTPVPFVPASVAGIINHRGTIFTLISFARLAGLGEDRPGAVVLLRLPEMAVGLEVEAIEGIERVPAVRAPAAAEGARPRTVPFLGAARDTAGRPAQPIDPEALIETIGGIADPARAGEAAPVARND